jgi:PncC family amidohydrolase
VTAAVSLGATFPESESLGRRLLDRGLTVALAESCTGGLLGAVITAIPGSSRYLRGGIIAYADQVKVQLLGVEPELLGRVGAVSAEVAAAMAQGAPRLLGADLGLAVTGVAGPGAGTGLKPVGLIYVAGWLRGRTHVVELRERSGREANRAAAVRAALVLGAELADAAPEAPQQPAGPRH